MKWIHGLVLLLCVALPFAAAADDAAPLPQPTLLSSPQQARLGEQRLRYRVSFDQLDFAGADGARVASISAIGYLAERTDADTRPVLFAFNGGPGASSVLQVEGLGPRLRVRDGKRQTLIANPHSILDAADLVFIDPPGTGFSQAPTDAAARARYWSDHGDAKAVEAMIRHWLKTHGRERAPLYIAGESYGGYRLALLAADIADLRPAGVLLVSPLLDATSGDDSPGNDLRAVFDLPSLIVAAAAHGKGELAGQPVEGVYAQARTFALGDYAQALLQGSALPADARSHMAARMAALLGLPAQALLAADLRPDVESFRLGVLAADGQQIGRLDSRVAAPLPAPQAADNGRPSAANDPALGLGRSNQITSAVMADYLHGLFGDGLPRDYVSLDIDIAMAWRFSADDGAGPRPFGSALRFNPTPNLARLAQANPGFHVLALNGYYDLAVPALGPWYALHHSALDPARIDFRLLPGGHAVFAEDALRPQLHGLLKDFLQ
ncbi:peptidase S10 [Xanthomonas sp. GW]|uniref:S10 family serine carboxypeptidase-like protein n=1 Tax=Xanthomonas sp. GW TaxID=2724121 RepID=UPI00163B1A7E|nr:peptidase S10 [Xanthomonas sp. GW]QNH22136.1 peptidase S10 [Xanthomonas sp. GW]